MPHSGVAGSSTNRSGQRVFANARAVVVVQQTTRDVDVGCDGELVERLIEKQTGISNQHPVVIEDDLLIGRVAGIRHRRPCGPVPDEQVVEGRVVHHHAGIGGGEHNRQPLGGRHSRHTETVADGYECGL